MEIIDLKDMYKGKKCHVFGNGPSLTEDIVNCARNDITIGTNGIVFNKWNFTPTYYVLNDYSIITDLNYFKHIKHIKSKVIISNWLLLKLKQQQSILNDEQKQFLNNSIIIPTVNFPGIIPRINSLDDISLDLEKGTFICGTTILDLALPLATYFGCNPIIISGCDCQPNGHFYTYKRDGVEDAGPGDRQVTLQWRLFAEKLKQANIKVYNTCKSNISCRGIEKI